MVLCSPSKLWLPIRLEERFPVKMHSGHTRGLLRVRDAQEMHVRGQKIKVL